MLGKQEAQFAQQFSRVRFRRRYSTADVKLADVEKLFPTLADGSHGKELAFMTGVCRSKWGIRGAMSVYTNAVRNENTSLDGLRGIAASSTGTFPMPNATVEDDARILALLHREGV